MEWKGVKRNKMVGGITLIFNKILLNGLKGLPEMEDGIKVEWGKWNRIRSIEMEWKDFQELNEM